MRITQATPADAPAIANILSTWNASTPWMPRAHSRGAERGFARMLVDKGWVQVARDPQRVVGFLARDASEIHALYLAPHARGRGVGKALLDQAKAHCDHLGLYTFVANDPARRFYLREGFIETHRTDGQDNDEGLPDIRFEWRATP
ncbi:N-acetyltransferase family protein [Aliiroseovarius crassostreae]|uniref:GNAT family N-acetyltransferase n=1 Tax=Aliiroseovarius crassostreae TaxID=154981 RepID=UPI003C7DE87F